jgi:hypothetical protein
MVANLKIRFFKGIKNKSRISFGFDFKMFLLKFKRMFVFKYRMIPLLVPGVHAFSNVKASSKLEAFIHLVEK